MTSNKSITLLKDVEPFKSCWCVQLILADETVSFKIHCLCKRL
ncbi:unnamed protein product [Brassica rapa]|uniref:Uncharacterized protein n=2 Tax=Brassica TaxID=3705 RepID=A0A3P5ZVY1_BRACM|nr:unnamed protein product [Brassica napus]CAG7885841.1 unnamed protein product [Brassica rapa]CDY32204.1 BnaA03g54630D [Brassica napus]VDC76158.1 unnamed protein product [Brassica rapa]